MKVTIVVPTYWKKYAQPCVDEAIYDHPTDLDGCTETLSRLLSSLTGLRVPRSVDFRTVVLGVPTTYRIAKKVEQRVNEIIADFQNSLNVTQFSFSDLKKLHKHLRSLGLSSFTRYLSLRGYGNVRNMCIVIPHFLGSHVAILLDDDEVVIDKDFLRKATEFVGKEYEGKMIWGITGYYTNKNGDYHLVEDNAWWKIFWNKEKQMNEAFKIVESHTRLNATTFALGGCMVIHRALFQNVPFDPWITRGEDMDYLVNAKIHGGFKFLFDNQLCVLHMPPKGYPLAFEQDVYRFLYQREKLVYMKDKLKLRNFSVDSLDPYPGYFLKSDLEAKIIITGFLRLIHQKYAQLADLKNATSLKQVLREVELLLNRARNYAQKHAANYLSFQEAWVDFIRKTGKATFLSEGVK